MKTKMPQGNSRLSLDALKTFLQRCEMHCTNSMRCTTIAATKNLRGMPVVEYVTLSNSSCNLNRNKIGRHVLRIDECNRDFMRD